MAQNYTSGYASYMNYGYEATYGSVASGTRVFGLGQKVTHTRRNNMERLYGIGARNATTTVAKKYEGSASVEFVLSNPSIFRAIMGAVADGGSGPNSYTHTYTETNILPSFSILTGTEMGTNDAVMALLGCKVGSATITASADEVVKVRLECPYKTETLATSGIGSQVAETFTPYTFAQGLVEWSGGGGSIGVVTSFELTINHSLEGLWGIGSRLKNTDVEKIREYNIKMTVAFNDVTALLTKFLGASGAPVAGTPAAQANIVLTFDSGSGTGLGSIVITLADVSFDEDTLPKDVNEILKEDVSGWALSGTSIVATNSVQTDEGNP
jgi:hypothetical protein